MSVDLDALPFVPARWYRQGRVRPIRLLVVHTPEFPELNDGAERLAQFFATTDRAASVHVTVDNDSMVRSVRDGDTAYGAENANADGLHAELVGYAGQSVEEWDDAYSNAVLANAGALFRAWADRHDIPLRRLSVEQIRAGEKGIAGHGDVYQALGGQAYRSDPGAAFPWDEFMGHVLGTNTAPTQKARSSMWYCTIPGPAGPGNPRSFACDGAVILYEVPYGAPRRADVGGLHVEALDSGLPIRDGQTPALVGGGTVFEQLVRRTLISLEPHTATAGGGGLTEAQVRTIVTDVVDGATLKV